MVAWLGPAIMAAGMLGSSAMSTFGKKDSVNQGPMMTPEQEKAQNVLANFMQSGNIGDYHAGTAYGGSLGNYDLTAEEGLGKSKLLSMLASGNPEMFGIGTDALKKLLTTDQFDPNNPTGEYKGFKSGVERNLQDANDSLKRNAGYQGNLYSTNINKESGLLQERGQQQLTNKLAELFSTYTTNKINAIPTALNAGVQQESMDMNRINAISAMGAKERALLDQKDKDLYNEFMRQRTEKQQQIGAAQALSGSNANFGVTSMPTANPWAQVLNTLTSVGGNIAGQTFNKWATATPTNNTTPAGPAMDFWSSSSPNSTPLPTAQNENWWKNPSPTDESSPVWEVR